MKCWAGVKKIYFDGNILIQEDSPRNEKNQYALGGKKSFYSWFLIAFLLKDKNLKL